MRGICQGVVVSSALPEDASSVLLLAGNVENLLRVRLLVEPAKNQSLKIDPILAANDIKSSAAALKTALDNVERENAKRNSRWAPRIPQ